MILLAAALTGCAFDSRLWLEGVTSVRYTAIASGDTWQASPEEASRVASAFRSASVIVERETSPWDSAESQFRETRPSARIDITLRSGDSVAIWGRGTVKPFVSRTPDFFYVDSDELALILAEIEAHTTSR